MSEECNGWTNRETWATALHLSNDHGLYLWCTDVAEQAVKEAAEWCDARDWPADERNYARWIGEAIRDEVLEAFNDTEFDPEFVAMMLRDIGSQWRIDWDAVGRSFMPESSDLTNK